VLYNLITILINILVVERLDEPMNVDNQNSEIVTHASSSCNAKNISINRQENLGINIIFSFIIIF